MPEMQIRGLLMSAALALVSGFTPAARAQTLLDVMGASAIQNSLQSLPAGAGSAVIERSRTTVDQASRAEQSRLDRLQQLGGSGSPPPAPSSDLMAPLMAPLMDMFRAVGLPGAPGAEGRPLSTTAKVNGQLVPYCSHGGLCHGALMRAVGTR